MVEEEEKNMVTAWEKPELVVSQQLVAYVVEVELVGVVVVHSPSDFVSPLCAVGLLPHHQILSQ